MSTIIVKKLRKKYGDFEALKGISFEIEKGEILGFLGPNGAGKTTTMKILTCFMSATSGEAKIMGKDCAKDDIFIRSQIGYLPENNPIYTDMAVIEYLKYVADIHGVSPKIINSRIKKVIIDCGLSQRVGQSINTLSKGYRQRVGLAAALIHDPEILILDEPTAGLDPNQIIEIRQLIKELGKEKTVILCSHNLTEVELTCNRVLIISHGEIVASGTPSELKKSMSGEANLKMTIKGNKKEVIKMLEGIRGVKRVVANPAKERGAYSYELLTIKKDIRPRIINEIIENEFKLFEIQKNTVSLEDIFNKFTQ